jgi:hypothetical protein
METCCIHPIYFVTNLRLEKREKRKKNVAIAGCKIGSTVKKPPKLIYVWPIFKGIKITVFKGTGEK